MGSALFSIFPQALFLGSVPSCEKKQHQTLLFLGKMDDQQQFCLRWNDFQTNMVASFKHLRDEKSFTDVTIACDGQSCKAHKMILSACSPYFKALLEKPSQAPYHHPERCALHPPDSYPGVHVRRGGECCARPAATVSQDSREAEGEGSGRGSSICQG